MKTKIILGLLFISLILVSGCWRTTENGKHFGQITAIEDTGLFWKTTTVYVKTDISSSQEDTYCLDKTQSNYNDLKDKLLKYADSREKVVILFHDEFWVWVTRCGGESAIIDGVDLK